MLVSGAVAFIIGVISIILMEKLNKPALSALGFIMNAVLIFVFMGKHGYMSTLLFIVSGLLVMYIKLIIKKLKSLKDSVMSYI